MDRFIARENIKRYRQMLAVESDEDRRRTLGELLARAEEDLAALVLTAGGINLLLWRARAEEARTQAEALRHAEPRRIMLGIADSYDQLVRDAEARLAKEMC